jgi:hypothetical protein
MTALTLRSGPARTLRFLVFFVAAVAAAAIAIRGESVIVGLVALVIAPFAVHAAGALLAPSLLVTVVPGEPRIGDPITISWAFQGRTNRITRVEVALVLREHIRTRRGKRTRTTTNELTQVVVADGPATMGQGAVTLGPGATPTGGTPGHRLVWTIEVIAHLPGRPDTHDAWEVRITGGTPRQALL